MSLRVPPAASTAPTPAAAGTGAAPPSGDGAAASGEEMAALSAAFLAFSRTGTLSSSFDLGKITDIVRKVVGDVGPQNPQHPQVDVFRQQTADFRDQLTAIRALEAKIAKLDPADPSLPALQAKLAGRERNAEQGLRLQRGRRAGAQHPLPRPLPGEVRAPQRQALGERAPGGDPRHASRRTRTRSSSPRARPSPWWRRTAPSRR